MKIVPMTSSSRILDFPAIRQLADGGEIGTAERLLSNRSNKRTFELIAADKKTILVSKD